MSKIYFSCNIIIFDSYQLSVNTSLNKNNKNNISSKSQITNNTIKEIIIDNKNKINFFTENKISLYNNFI